MKKEIEFYSKQGVRTKVSKVTVDNFSDSLEEIIEIIHGFLIHPGEIKFRNLDFSKEKFTELMLNSVEKVLNKVKELGEDDLLLERNFDKKVIGICRDFSMILTSVLVSKGIPARCRCGFATYFREGYEDHWICEYWNGEKWVQVDPQMSEVWKKKLGIEKKNALNLMEGDFFNGAEVWKFYREGKINPSDCGFSLKEGAFGEWYIRGNMLRDFFSLNKIQYLYDEKTDLMSRDYFLNEDDLKLLDQISELIIDKDFEGIRKLYLDRKNLRPREI